METPFGMKRNDDVVLRLQSAFRDPVNESFLPLDQRQWYDLYVKISKKDDPRETHSEIN